MTESPQHHHDEEFVPADDAVIGRAFRWSMAVIGIVAVAIVSVIVVRNWNPAAADEVIPKDPGEIAGIDRTVIEMPAVRFLDIAAEAGIDFVHFNGATGEKLLPETMGGGCAIFDYNNNGRQDVLLVNSTHWPHDTRNNPRNSPSANTPPTMKLYRNDAPGRFTDVTTEAGLNASFYGMGVAVGDVNNDGNVDVFFTAVGPNHFYRNVGGRFVEATAEAGLAGEENEWSTSAGFFDMNLNGLLDLFVCNYIQWSREIDIELNFTLNGRDRAYGPPTNYRGAQSYLYRNEPGAPGTFTEIGESAGIHVNNPATGLPMGKALALAFADVSRNGLIDIFIANDTTQNFLFLNLGEGQFREVGARSGVAFSPTGQATGAMGIDAAHYRNDDALAVGIGNFANEMTSFYVSQRDPMQFSDEGIGEGIGSPTRIKLSFGLFFFDYDLDGRLDLLQANGHLEDEINQIQSSQHYEQPAQLFWNAGPQRRSCYVEVPAESLGDLSRPIVGRGAAYGDLDGDGDLDVLLTQIAGPPLLLRNEQATGHNWLRVKLIGDGATVNRDAIGATIDLVAGGMTQRRMVMPTRSYLSQVELPLTFGLGEAESVDSLIITWPGGQTQTVDVHEVNATITVRQRTAG